MKRDAASLASRFHDGDIVDVHFDFGDGPAGAERVDFGGVETDEGVTAIVQYFVREDLTCDWIDLNDVTDIRLVQPWTARSAADLLTNTIGAGSQPVSQSSLAHNGKRFRTKRPMKVSPIGAGPQCGDRSMQEVEVPAGTIVIVTLANPDATQLVLKSVEDKYAFVLEVGELEELLDAS